MASDSACCHCCPRQHGPSLLGRSAVLASCLLNNIDIRHHYIHDLIRAGVIDIEQVPSEDNLADLFTKPLPHNRHNRLLAALDPWHQVSPSSVHGGVLNYTWSGLQLQFIITICSIWVCAYFFRSIIHTSFVLSYSFIPTPLSVSVYVTYLT